MNRKFYQLKAALVVAAASLSVLVPLESLAQLTLRTTTVSPTVVEPYATLNFNKRLSGFATSTQTDIVLYDETQSTALYQMSLIPVSGCQTCYYIVRDAIINPSTSAQLDPNSTYKVVFAANTVDALDGDTWPASEFVIDIVTTGDTEKPNIAFSAANQTFSNGGWGVARDFTGPFYFILDENVTVGSGQITFTNNSDASFSESLDLSSDNVTIVDVGTGIPSTVVGVVLDRPLRSQVPLSDNYTFSVPAGAFRDPSNNGTDAFSIDVSQNINLPSSLSLSIDAADRTENNQPFTRMGEILIDVPFDIRTEFELTMAPASQYPDNSFFYIFNRGIYTNTIFDFETKSSYTVGIQVGVPGGAKETFEATIAVINQTSEAMLVTSTSPPSSPFSPGIGSVPGRLTVNFNQDALPGTGSVRLYETAGDVLVETFTVGSSSGLVFEGSALHIYPTTPLSTNTGYYVLIDNGAVRNWVGFSGATDWDFVTPMGVFSPSGPYNISLSNTTIAENQLAGTFVGSLSTENFTASTTHDYTFTETGTTSLAPFALLENPFSGAWSLSATEGLDFETQSSYSLSITTTDNNGRSYTEAFTIQVTNTVSEPPSEITLDRRILVEGKPAGELVGTLSAIDPEGQPVTFTVPGGSQDNSFFTIANGNELVTSQVLSTATKSEYSVAVRVEDADGYFFSQLFTIPLMPNFSGGSSVSKTSQAITFPALPAAQETDVLTLNATSNAGLEVVYSVTSGPGFINENNELAFTDGGTVVVAANQPGNVVFNAAQEVTQEVSVTAVEAIIDIPDAALKACMVAAMDTNQDGEIQESEATGFTGPLNCFNKNITDATGLQSLVNARVINLTQNRLTTLDVSGLQGLTSLRVSRNQLTSLTLPTAGNLTELFADENSLTAVANLTTQTSMSRLFLSRNQYASIDASFTSSLSVLSVGSPNLTSLTIGTQPNLTSFTILESDGLTVDLSPYPSITTGLFGGATTTVTMDGLSALTTLRVDNGYDPAKVNWGVSNALVDVTVRTNNSVTFLDLSAIPSALERLSIISMINLEIIDLTGVNLSSLISDNFTNLGSLSCVITDDVAGTTAALTTLPEGVTVATSCPEPPTDIALSATSIDENNAVDDVVGTLSTTDANADDTFSYSLVSGTGSTDNASFAISGATLIAKEVFDFETTSSYSVRIQTEDNTGRTFAKAFTISINDLPENSAPTAIALSPATIDENNAIDDVIGTFSTTDGDASDSHNYTLVAGEGDTDNASFTVSGDQLLAAEVFDFETKDSYSIRVQTDDGNGGVFATALTVTVNDVDETVVSTEGIEAGMRLYPNPTTGRIFIEGGYTGSLVLYNALGTAVLALPSQHHTELLLQGLPAGLYLLRTEAGTTHRIMFR